jgi:metal-sulfur cluster biosynthetic enzyme
MLDVEAQQATAAAVMGRLGTVLDPCSLHNGTRLSFVDLGMVDDVQVTPSGHVTIELLLDDPVCMYMVDIILSVEQAVRVVPGVTGVEVSIAGDRLWDRDRLTDATKAKIARWQTQRQALLGAGRRTLPMLD